MPKVQADVKIRIMSATKQILQEKKDGDFTMRDIAKRCDIALGTIYNYYPGKAELVIDIVAEMWDVCFEEMRQITNQDFYDCIRQVYEILTHYMKGFSANLMWRLANLNAEGKQLSESFDQRYIAICKDLLVGIINKYLDRFDKTILQKMQPEELAEFVLRHLLSMAMGGGGDYEKFDYFIRKLLST